MIGLAASATEESGATAIAAALGDAEVQQLDRGFLKDTRRNLTPEEAASAAGIQWFQYEIARLDRECSQLRAEATRLRALTEATVEKYNDKRVEFETLKGSVDSTSQNETLSTLIIAAGSSGVSVASVYLADPKTHSFALAVLVISILSVGLGIFLRKRS